MMDKDGRVRMDVWFEPPLNIARKGAVKRLD